LAFYCGVLKSVAFVALVRKAADEIRIVIFFKSFRVKKIDELVIISKKLTNNFTGTVIASRVPYLSRRLPVGPHRYRS
jgi:hypothetical protein